MRDGQVTQHNKHKHKMKIYNSVTYTIPMPAYGKNCRTEQTARFVRPYKLTRTGAERIIKKKLIEDGELGPRDKWDGRVLRIEYVRIG